MSPLTREVVYDQREVELNKYLYAMLAEALLPEERFAGEQGRGLILFTPYGRRILFKPKEEDDNK